MNESLPPPFTLRSHITEVFRHEHVDFKTVAKLAVASLAISFPLFLGAWSGNFERGVVASLGALLASSGQEDSNHKTLATGRVNLLTALAFAALTAHLVSMVHYAALASVPILLLAAFLGGYNFASAVWSARFIAYMIISLSVGARGNLTTLIALLLFGAIGAMAWQEIVRRTFAAMDLGGRHPPPEAPNSPPARVIPPFYLRLKTLQGWQFILRLAPCLIVGAILADFFPTHHYIWVLLTVSLLCRRILEVLAVRTTQRALGVLFGTLLTAPLVSHSISLPTSLLIVILFSPLTIYFKVRNYMTYAMFMTPILAVLISAGQSVSLTILVDRIFSTIFGSGLVIGVNAMMVNLLKRKVSQLK